MSAMLIRFGLVISFLLVNWVPSATANESLRSAHVQRKLNPVFKGVSIKTYHQGRVKRGKSGYLLQMNATRRDPTYNAFYSLRTGWVYYRNKEPTSKGYKSFLMNKNLNPKQVAERFHSAKMNAWYHAEIPIILN